MKVVLDTNVFISGIFFRDPPYLVLKAWRDGKIKLVVSEKIIEEYLRVGEILSKQFTQIRLGPILELMMVEAEFTADLKLPIPVCSDPEDDKFLECAIAGKADVLVSGDKHLLKVSGYGGIDVVTPRKFVDRFLKYDEVMRPVIETRESGMRECEPEIPAASPARNVRIP